MGVIRTDKVGKRTTLLLVRFRYHIITLKEGAETPLLAEECQLLGFSGSPEKAKWLKEERVEALLLSEPDANITPDLASNAITRIIDGFDHLRPRLEKEAKSRAEQLLDAHRRVRTAARLRGLRYKVEPHLPPDVLGIYVYLPVV